MRNAQCSCQQSQTRSPCDPAPPCRLDELRHLKLDFLAEIKILALVQHSGGHKHVLGFLGCIFSAVMPVEEMMIVTEYAEHGSLLSYLRTQREDVNVSRAHEQLRPATTLARPPPPAPPTAVVLHNVCIVYITGCK